MNWAVTTENATRIWCSPDLSKLDYTDYIHGKNLPQLSSSLASKQSLLKSHTLDNGTQSPEPQGKLSWAQETFSV